MVMLFFTHAPCSWETELDKERNPLPFVFRKKACKEPLLPYGLDKTNGWMPL